MCEPKLAYEPKHLLHIEGAAAPPNFEHHVLLTPPPYPSPACGGGVGWGPVRSLRNASHSAVSPALSAENRSSNTRELRMRSTRKWRKSPLSSHHAPTTVTST